MQEFLNTILSGQNDPKGIALPGAVFFVFMFIFFAVLAISDIVKRRSDIRKRAAAERITSADDVAPEQNWETMSRSLRFQSAMASSALLSSVERGQKVAGRESEASKVRRALIAAGYFGASAATWFQAIRFSLTATFPFITYMALLLSGTGVQPSVKMMVLLSAAGVGYLLPGRYLVHRQKLLQQECRNGFPDFMDLMVICAEAGLSPRAAIDRIGREISHTYPYLGANIYLMSLELRAGSTLGAAVQNLWRRTGLEEVAALGSLLQQTEQLGTSIGDALRVYSDEMRDKRLSRAEEKAYALPVKLTLPLGLYVFPVMLLVVALPVIVRIKNALF